VDVGGESQEGQGGAVKGPGLLQGRKGKEVKTSRQAVGKGLGSRDGIHVGLTPDTADILGFIRLTPTLALTHGSIDLFIAHRLDRCHHEGVSRVYI